MTTTEFQKIVEQNETYRLQMTDILKRCDIIYYILQPLFSLGYPMIPIL